MVTVRGANDQAFRMPASQSQEGTASKRGRVEYRPP